MNEFEYNACMEREELYQCLAELNSSELVAGVLPGAAPAEDTDSPESRGRSDHRRALKPLELTAAVFHIGKVPWLISSVYASNGIFPSSNRGVT